MIIGLFALYICNTLQVALICGYRALQALTYHYEKVVKSNKFGSFAPPLHYWQPPGLKGLFREHFMPGAFALLWLALLIVLRLSQSTDLAALIQSFTLTRALDVLEGAFSIIGLATAIYFFRKWKGPLPERAESSDVHTVENVRPRKPSSNSSGATAATTDVHEEDRRRP